MFPFLSPVPNVNRSEPLLLASVLVGQTSSQEPGPLLPLFLPTPVTFLLERGCVTFTRLPSPSLLSPPSFLPDVEYVLRSSILKVWSTLLSRRCLLPDVVPTPDRRIKLSAFPTRSLSLADWLPLFVARTYTGQRFCKLVSIRRRSLSPL